MKMPHVAGLKMRVIGLRNAKLRSMCCFWCWIMRCRSVSVLLGGFVTLQALCDRWSAAVLICLLWYTQHALVGWIDCVHYLSLVFTLCPPQEKQARIRYNEKVKKHSAGGGGGGGKTGTQNKMNTVSMSSEWYCWCLCIMCMYVGVDACFMQCCFVCTVCWFLLGCGIALFWLCFDSCLLVIVLLLMFIDRLCLWKVFVWCAIFV